MNTLRRALCRLLTLSLCLLLALPSGAAGETEGGPSFTMYPDSDRLVTDEEINTFFSGLTAGDVESLQVVYVDPWAEMGQEWADLSHEPTPIDPAEYPALVALLREIQVSKPERLNPATGVGPQYYLAITTKTQTVKLNLWGSSNRTVFGSLGAASLLEFVPAPSRGPLTPYEKLCSRLIQLPEVQRVEKELDKKNEDWFEALRNQEEREAGLRRMNGPAILPKPENPPELAVSAADVAEYNLFLDGYWAQVTGLQEQRKILNLVNSIETDWNPSASKAKKGEVLLQLRLQDGGKHEYQLTSTGTGLKADNSYYFDRQAILIFDEALGEILRGYPTGIAWLGTMNRKNVTKMAVEREGKRTEYSAERDPQALEAAVSRLRGITLHGGSSRRVPNGSAPPELNGKPAGCRVQLTFQNGITYQLAFYEGKLATIASSDMAFSYFYQAERIEAAA